MQRFASLRRFRIDRELTMLAAAKGRLYAVERSFQASVN